MTKIYFSYIFGLRPRFLARNFQNPWDFLGDESYGSHNMWSFVLSSGNRFRTVRWNRCLFVYNKPLSTTVVFMLMR